MSDWKQQRPFKGRGPNTLQQYADKHTIHNWLVSWPHRDYDPWELLKQARSFLEGLNEYTAVFRPSKMFSDGMFGGHSTAERVIRLLGSYPISDAKHQKWANPEYAHGGNYHIPAEDRMHHIELCCENGWIGSQAIADRYNLSKSTIQDYARRRGVSMQAAKKDGRTRIARSLYTSAQWTDKSVSELCELLPVTKNTALTWIRRYVYQSDWQSPRHPVK